MNQIISFITISLLFGVVFGQSVLRINQNNLHPEGIEYSKQHGFLVSSRQGTVYKVDSEGNLYPFVVHDRFQSTLGLHIDAKRNLLLIANSNGSLVEADLSTGKVTREVDLSKVGAVGNKFANDVTSDKDGNVYITDGYHAQIYKVTPDGTATVFAADARFGGKQGTLGLTGIDYHPDGYIIAVNQQYGLVFRIDIANPKEVSGVQLPSALVTANGLTFRSNGNLIVVQNNKVTELKSSDNWTTCFVVAEAKTKIVGSSTATLRDEQVFVVHPHAGEDSTVYEIEKIVL